MNEPVYYHYHGVNLGGLIKWWLWRRVENERSVSRTKFPQRNAKRLRIIINDLK